MRKIIVTVAAILIVLFPLFAADRDFASEVKLNMRSETAKQKVTVHAFVDGDTTHFNVPVSISENGILKARYLAVNTPESTGRWTR